MEILLVLVVLCIVAAAAFFEFSKKSQVVGMARDRRELFLDHGRVFIETPQLMTNAELADVLETFVKEVRSGQPMAQPEPPTQAQPETATSRRGEQGLPAAKAKNTRPASRKRKLR